MMPIVQMTTTMTILLIPWAMLYLVYGFIPKSVSKNHDVPNRYLAPVVSFPAVLIFKKQMLFYIFCGLLIFAISKCYASIDFLSGQFSFPTSFLVERGYTLLAYELLAFCTTLPLSLHYLFSLSKKRFVSSSSKLEAVLMFLFNANIFLITVCQVVSIATLLIPYSFTSEYRQELNFFVSTLALIVPLWGIIFTFFGTIFSRLNVALLSYLVAGKKEAAILLMSRLTFMDSPDFSIDLLQSRPDSEVSELIDTAREMGNLEIADEMSSYLLKRHTLDFCYINEST